MANIRKNELTDFGKKIKNILNEKNITQAQLGKMLGIAQNSVSTRLSRLEIGFDNMLDIAHALGYDIELKLVPLEPQNNIKLASNTSQTKSMPISVVAAGAGISTKFTIDNAFEKKSFPSDVVPPNADCGIRINGDSMSPDYPNDCIVWVKQTTEVKYGDEVIAILNGCPYFKIYDREGLRSINPEYPIIKVYDDDKFSVFGKVIGVYTGNIK